MFDNMCLTRFPNSSQKLYKFDLQVEQAWKRAFKKGMGVTHVRKKANMFNVVLKKYYTHFNEHLNDSTFNLYISVYNNFYRARKNTLFWFLNCSTF